MRTRTIAWGIAKGSLTLLGQVRAVLEEDRAARGPEAEVEDLARKQIEKHLLDASVAIGRVLAVLGQERRRPLRLVGQHEKPKGAA